MWIRKTSGRSVAACRRITHMTNSVLQLFDVGATWRPANVFSDSVLKKVPIFLYASIKRRASFVQLCNRRHVERVQCFGPVEHRDRDVIMFSYFASRADAGDALLEDTDAVVDVDVNVELGW